MSRSPTDSMRMVAIAPDVPGSVPYGMNGDFSRMSIISSPEASKSSPPDSGVAFVKGGKRKRLSKACDACHKSKRRCDGTGMFSR
ncbi:hypothetical protein EW026_g3149 [Hermanssonia centrifuga]|uniref:Uncharacterized protein n=1 Tax=Hermanssonia centrifuga TaxID=98765 RepID=A0A4V3XAR6_9APHY|nr:hypothetical protein EW026_g3149 [Hermanssonia centrifuga]